MTMTLYRFDRFTLDTRNRQLSSGGEPLHLTGRYLDALALLISQPGQLVTKELFHREVWRGIPVTDEALTQCIRTLRRQLGDDAAASRFIETVPKHGYRFIAAVEEVEGSADRIAETYWPRRQTLLHAGAGTLGAALAGTLGGFAYGAITALQPLAGESSGGALLLVVLSVTMLTAAIGGAGVATGIALADGACRFQSPVGIMGGAIGGALVGAVVKLLALNVFALLLGQSPGEITGAAEGFALGAAVGTGHWLAGRTGSAGRGVFLAMVVGAAAGFAIPLAGGRMFGGSLHLLERSFPGSMLRLDPIGRLLGEQNFGIIGQCVTGAIEGGLFAGCIVGAMIWARHAPRARN